MKGFKEYCNEVSERIPSTHPLERAMDDIWFNKIRPFIRKMRNVGIARQYDWKGDESSAQLLLYTENNENASKLKSVVQNINGIRPYRGKYEIDDDDVTLYASFVIDKIHITILVYTEDAIKRAREIDK
jgi:hypothetical protein